MGGCPDEGELEGAADTAGAELGVRRKVEDDEPGDNAGLALDKDRNVNAVEPGGACEAACGEPEVLSAWRALATFTTPLTDAAHRCRNACFPIAFSGVHFNFIGCIRGLVWRVACSERVRRRTDRLAYRLVPKNMAYFPMARTTSCCGRHKSCSIGDLSLAESRIGTGVRVTNASVVLGVSKQMLKQSCKSSGDMCLSRRLHSSN